MRLSAPSVKAAALPPESLSMPGNPARPAAAVCAALLLLALAGLWVHGDLRHTPEVVVMRPEQKVLSSPLESATPLLALPAGAIVRQLDRRGQWLEIQYDGTHGWLPAAAVEPVS